MLIFSPDIIPVGLPILLVVRNQNIIFYLKCHTNINSTFSILAIISLFCYRASANAQQAATNEAVFCLIILKYTSSVISIFLDFSI